MAGSAILEATRFRDTLGSVTLTINNSCNLACPHCYLQYDGAKRLIGASTVDAVLASSCERICVVGKEPLADRSSIAVLTSIARRARERGKSVSLITNGLNAGLLPGEAARDFAWIDISLDGGPRTYESYRKGSWSKLLRAIDSLRAKGVTDLRLLQTISVQNCDAVGDMLEAHEMIGAAWTVFSPFQATRSDGHQGARALPPCDFLDAVAPAAGCPETIIALDALYAGGFGDDGAIARARNLFGPRLIYVDTDPIDRGLVRVTYDDLVLTPFTSVDTASYRESARRLGDRDLDEIFSELRSHSPAARLH